MSYADLLRDPRWQRKRLEVLSASNFSCVLCDATDKTLNVHHVRYRKGAKPWEYEACELRSLCEECHESSHKLQDSLKDILGSLSLDDIEQVLGYAAGLHVRHLMWNEKPISTAPGAAISASHASGVEDAMGLDVEAWISICHSASSHYDWAVAAQLSDIRRTEAWKKANKK